LQIKLLSLFPDYIPAGAVVVGTNEEGQVAENQPETMAEQEPAVVPPVVEDLTPVEEEGQNRGNYM